MRLLMLTLPGGGRLIWCVFGEDSDFMGTSEILDFGPHEITLVIPKPRLRDSETPVLEWIFYEEKGYFFLKSVRSFDTAAL